MDKIAGLKEKYNCRRDELHCMHPLTMKLYLWHSTSLKCRQNDINICTEEGKLNNYFVCILFKEGVEAYKFTTL